MTDLVQFASVAFVEFRLALSSEFAYKWQVLIWVISDTIQPIIFAVLWSAVAMTGTRDFTAGDMISYYFMVMIVSRLTQDWSIQFVSNSIIAGDFSKYLVRPFNYLSEMFGISLAVRTLRIVIMLPLIIVGNFLLKDHLNYVIDPNSLILFFFSLCIGFALNFVLGNIFALLAIFIKQIVGLRALYVNFLSILSGEYIPLKVLAVGTFFLFEVLPFRYTLSFPIEIISDDLSVSQVQRGFLISIIWLIVLIVLYNIVYKIAIKKYESEGI